MFIANRGEIALRVARTCRRIGIVSVVACTRGEERSPHAAACDEKVLLPGDGTAAYLDIDAMVEAAGRAGCQAVHPGYGFLAENPRFATAVKDAGLIFVGPPAEAIRRMGDKGAAKKLARDNGVPTLDSVAEETPDEAGFASAAGRLGFPLLLKPRGGGGGKGMIKVECSEDLPGAINRSRHEGEAAFGDRRLLAETFAVRSRHVEVQIAADRIGSVRHLFDRDCSLQRRHQKILEESPAPEIDSGLRRRMREAAVTLAGAVGYQNLGTVEFLYDPAGSFHFLEMNTRLQVEHPVTEMVTGRDLVELQIRIAEGLSLEETVGKVRISGHAIEARIYAEDPEGGFLPSPGRILLLRLPAGEGIRVDTGIAEGMKVGPAFDPLLMKLIAHGKDRVEAIERLDRALRELVLLGIGTNVNFLLWILEQEPVRRSRHDTGWIENHLSEYRVWEEARDVPSAVAVMRAREEHELQKKMMAAGEEPWFDDPFRTLGNWRLGEAR